MEPGTVTRWLGDIRRGSDDAVESLWEFYQRPLRAALRRKLSTVPSRALDDEDFAITTFYSFLRRTREGQFPALEDRDDAWRYLVVIAMRKALNFRRHESCGRRSSWRISSAKRQLHSNDDDVLDTAPTPDVVAMVADSVRNLISRLATIELREIATAKLSGYTNEELAGIFNISLATVERRLRLIRMQWEGQLERD